MFRNADESHAHSREVLDTLYEYDDFMLSVSSMVDLGCGSGLDLEWWATRTTRDDDPQPLNIKCTGVDLAETLSIARKYPNITYQRNNFEKTVWTPKDHNYDILWSHDSFQYATNPLGTLDKWWHIATPGAMLIITVPQTTNAEYKKLAFTQPSGCYHHHTIVSLMHQMAVTGWDTGSGFFKKYPDSPWLYAIAYRSEHAPMDPQTESWYSLAKKGLLHESAVDSVNRWGYVKQQDLVLPWIDKNFTAFGQH